MSVLTPEVSFAGRRWSSISEFLTFWLRSNPLSGPERETFDRYYVGYRRKFGAYIQHHFANQTQEMTALLRAAPGTRVLEVGAGCGTESLWFALQGADVTAIDLAVDRLAVARARQQWLQSTMQSPVRARFVESSLFDFKPEERFDIVWMEQTFHHIEPRPDVFPKLLSLLKPGGTLIVSESNAWNLPMQLQLFMRRGLKTKTFTTDPQGRRVAYGNERITTPFALCRGMRHAGFEVQAVRPFRLLPNVETPSAWIGVERGVLSALPWLSTHFNVVAKRPLA